MRKTAANLLGGLDDYHGHADLADRGARRYHPFSFDFDSTPLGLAEPEDHWDEKAKNVHLERRTQLINRLKLDYGTRHIDSVMKNAAELGPKSMSLLSYHNQLHEQARRAFVSGLFYPALVAACALGERVLNHLILDLRDHFKISPHYKKVYRKDSFDDWPFAVRVLTDWNVLANDVGSDFLALSKLRNSSIHFDPEAYVSLRDDALGALRRLDGIISKQFGYLGGQPWFIPETPGTQFVRKSSEQEPFVRTYIIPRSAFVGPLYGMDFDLKAGWRHLDYTDYGDEVLSDEQFALKYRERDPKTVVSRAMIEQNGAG